MNQRLVPLIFLAAIFSIPAIAVQSVYAGVECPPGECGFDFSKPTFTSGKVMVDPVVGINGNSFTLHYQDVVTVKRDTSMDCADNNNPGTFVEPTSVYLNAGPFSDNWGGGGGEGEAAGFLLQPAFALTPGQSIHQLMLPTGNQDEVSTTIGPIYPSHGSGPLSFEITCPVGSTPTDMDISFPIYVDPSGLVLDACTGDPIEGAFVELTVDYGIGFVQPNNFDIDPQDFGEQFTFSDGSYGWDVNPAGYDWKVTVTSASGYVVPQSLGPYTISSADDAVTDANFYLQPIGQSCAIGGTLVPIDSAALLLAGAQTSALWILPIVLAGAGLVAFKLRRN